MNDLLENINSITLRQPPDLFQIVFYGSCKFEDQFNKDF